jgi:hypothetical protein
VHSAKTAACRSPTAIVRPNSSNPFFSSHSDAQERVCEGPSPESNERTIHRRYHGKLARGRSQRRLRIVRFTNARPARARHLSIAAAWLHDVAKAEDADHGREGARAARRILAETDFSPAKIAAVTHAITEHVGLWRKTPVEPLEAAILWDADKLSKLGATAVLHFTGNLVDAGRGSTEDLLDALPAEDWQPRTVESLHTAPARAAGQQRLSAYRSFTRRFAREYKGDDLT